MTPYISSPASVSSTAQRILMLVSFSFFLGQAYTADLPADSILEGPQQSKHPKRNPGTPIKSYKYNNSADGGWGGAFGMPKFDPEKLSAVVGGMEFPFNGGYTTYTTAAVDNGTRVQYEGGYCAIVAYAAGREEPVS
ncbi:hypothetical protein B9Z19DRAFT_1060787 [Tuber borchii]|uniref:Uncharacterized protein n=1 Tax=Tuber borchii TaxID=42251 RepID=A0A2T7A7F7_TUBBO|nr:hypothetical protein B9Z19DRAFT_1060787 [Tuber borchii]